MTQSKRRFFGRGRVIRWAIYLTILAVVLTQFQDFGCMRIGSEGAEAMSPVLTKGKSYMVDEEPPELLIRDAIVLWYTRDEEGEAEPHYSRVRGVPGDLIKQVGETWAFEDAENELHYLPRELEVVNMKGLLGHRLGAHEYWLLNDNLPVDMPDSRTLGIIQRKWVRARILPAVFGGER